MNLLSFPIDSHHCIQWEDFVNRLVTGAGEPPRQLMDISMRYATEGTQATIAELYLKLKCHVCCISEDDKRVSEAFKAGSRVSAKKTKKTNFIITSEVLKKIIAGAHY